MAKINLSIITPERTVYDAQVDQVTLTTTEGEITVLPHHISLVSVLAPGEVRVVQGNEIVPLAVAGGFVEVFPGDRVAILADDALRVEEMDVAAIEAARERAREVLAGQRAVDTVSFSDATASLQKEFARLRIARKYHRRPMHREVDHG